MAPLLPTNQLSQSSLCCYARTHTLTPAHLTLATPRLGQAKLAEPGRPLGTNQQSSRRCCSHFPFCWAKEPKATGRGCPEASCCIPLLTADSQLASWLAGPAVKVPLSAEECNLLTSPTSRRARLPGGFMGVLVSTLPAPGGPDTSDTLPSVGIDAHLDEKVAVFPELCV